MLLWVVSGFYCTLVLVTTGFVLWYLTNTKAYKKAYKGKLIYKVDLLKRKIFARQLPTKKQSNKLLFPIQMVKNQWEDLDLFLKNFNSSPKTEKEIREFFNYAPTSSKKQTLQFNHQVKNSKTSYLLDMKIQPIYDNSDLQLEVNWLRNKTTPEKNQFTKAESREKIVQNNAKYKSFVAFRVADNRGYDKEKLLGLIKKHRLLRNRKQVFFGFRDLLVFVFFSNKSSQNKKTTKNFLKRVNKKMSLLGFGIMFQGSAYAITKNVKTNNKLNSFLEFLSFCCYVSHKTNQVFISNKSPEFSKSLYAKYISNLNSFKNQVKTHKYELSKLPVREHQNKKRVGVYLVPTKLNLHSTGYDFSFLKYETYAKTLVNGFAQYVAENALPLEKNSLLDVFGELVLQEKFENFPQELVYVLNFHHPQDLHPNLIPTLKKLTKKGFMFGLKVDFKNNFLANGTFLTLFKWVVVSSSFLDHLGNQRYVNLVSLKKRLEKTSTKVLFQKDLPEFDNLKKEHIGFKYFVDRRFRKQNNQNS